MLSPSSVSEYSTLGGTTGYTVRVKSPLASSSRSCCVSILGVAWGMSLRSSPKRSVRVSRCHRISVLYFPPISLSVASTGQFTSSQIRSIGRPPLFVAASVSVPAPCGPITLQLYPMRRRYANVAVRLRAIAGVPYAGQYPKG
jgi:hypothetical protein